MGLPSLVATVHGLFTAGLAHSTRRVYKAGGNCYVEFCGRAGLEALPVTERILCLFTAHLYREGHGAGTVKCYLSAVRHMQIAAG